MEERSAWKYLAFLSYASADKTLAIRLQRSLESFRVPKTLRAEVSDQALPPRLGKIFRDRSDLAASPSLPTALRDALAQSQSLIVLCSPAAAKPESWVTREIALFRQLHPGGKIFAVIASGSPAEAFPAVLLDAADPTQQPLAADLRDEGDGPRDGTLKLIAALLGVDFDALRRRHEEAERRRKRRAVAVVSAYAVTITIAVAMVAMQAIDLDKSRRESIAEAAKSANEKGQFDTAMLLALTALPRRAWPFVEPSARAEAQLQRAWLSNRLRAVSTPHDATIWAASFDPERGLAVTGSDRGEVAVVEVLTGRRVINLKGHRSSIRAVALARDLRTLATTGDDGDIRVWEWPSGKPKWVFHEERRKFSAAALSDDSRWLVTGDSEGVSHVWDLHAGARTVAGPRQPGRMQGAVFSADGERILTSSFGNSVVEWERRSGKPTRVFPFQGVTPGVVSRHPTTGFWVTTYALANWVSFWNPVTGERELSLDAGDHVSSVAFTKDGKSMLVGGWGRTARLVDTSTNEFTAVFDHPEWVDAVGFADHDAVLITAGHDGRVRAWRNPSAFAPAKLYEHSCRGPSVLVRLPGDDRLLFGGFDGALHVLDRKGSIAQTLETPVRCAANLLSDYRTAIRAVAVSHDGRSAAAGNGRGEIVLHSLDGSQSPPVKVRTSPVAIRSLSFIPPGNRLAAVTDDGQLSIWAVPGLRPVTLAAAIDTKNVYSVSFSPNARWIAIARRDGPAIDLYEIATGRRVRRMTHHGRVITGFAWSRDSRRLAATSADERASIMDVEDGEKKPVILRGDRTMMVSADWTPTSHELFTAGQNGAIHAWHRASGEMLGRWKLSASLSSITYDHASERIVVATTSGTVLTIPFPKSPKSRYRDFGCSQLPIGRRGFSTAEMLERPFLSAKDRQPCR